MKNVHSSSLTRRHTWPEGPDGGLTKRGHASHERRPSRASLLAVRAAAAELERQRLTLSSGGYPLPHYLAHIALLVRDYDEAIAWFVDLLGFRLVQDTPVAPEKRWVLVAPPGAREAMLLLARAATEEQRATVGRQGGGRVFLFLHTDDFARDYDAFRTRGIAFLETPREEPYGTVAVFEDLYGNRWDLIQPRTSAVAGLPY